MNAARPLKVGPRDGEFGKSWTRVIGSANYWFVVGDSPVGRRVRVMRIELRGDRRRSYVHTLYNCDPDVFEAWISAKFASRVISRDAR